MEFEEYMKIGSGELNYKIPSNSKNCTTGGFVSNFNYKGDMFRQTAIFRPTYIKHQ
jgi:hypothetical protein